MQDNTPQPPKPAKQAVPLDEKFPDGTTPEDRVCWVCTGATIYRYCKIICKNCGFTRDCSDP